jgi:hypothetical protein
VLAIAHHEGGKIVQSSPPQPAAAPFQESLGRVGLPRQSLGHLGEREKSALLRPAYA